MFQRRVDELFSNIPNVFCIANDSLTASCNKQGRDHDETLGKVLQICGKANAKPDKDKYLFRCTSITFCDSEFHDMV